MAEKKLSCGLHGKIEIKEYLYIEVLSERPANNPKWALHTPLYRYMNMNAAIEFSFFKRFFMVSACFPFVWQNERQEREKESVGLSLHAFIYEWMWI